jgi:hypothetical protein
VTKETTKRSPILYAIAVWMIVNIFLMATLIASGDIEDLNNWIEIAFWAISIPALLSNKKWGVAFALFILIYFKHQRGHTALLPNLAKRPPSHHQLTNHNLPIQLHFPSQIQIANAPEKHNSNINQCNFLIQHHVGRSSSLVRTLALRAKGRRFKSGSAHHLILLFSITSLF